jgi:transposase
MASVVECLAVVSEERRRPPHGGRRAASVALDPQTRSELAKWVAAGTTEQRLAARARIVLLAADGLASRAIGAEVRLSENTVGKWRRRFLAGGPTALVDAPRSGRPTRYTPEQKAWVIQKAIETPRENGRPITHWSSSSLAALAVAAGVAAMHPSTVSRLLNDADLQPHRSRYWLKITDPDFEQRMKDVTALYLRAPELAKRGVPVFCVDEKTSMQALERETPDLLMKPGKPHRRDHRYRRHGTTILLGAFHVATGKVWGMFTPTRPATVFADFVQRLCDSVPKAPEIHFVMDQLSTHWHDEVCRVVAAASGVTYDPRKHKTGAARRAFLADPSKRVVVHFTPVRASWLDQIEIWFSMLARQVLNRGSFTSIAELQRCVYAFMTYYNRFLARPFRWTYTGTPCRK